MVTTVYAQNRHTLVSRVACESLAHEPSGSGAASPGPAEDVAGYEDVAPVLSAEEKAAADAFEAEQQALRAEFNEDQKKREEDHEAAVKMQAPV